MSGMPNPDHLLTTAEVADRLRVSIPAARRFIKQHHIAVKVGREYRVPLDRLHEVLTNTNSNQED